MTSAPALCDYRRLKYVASLNQRKLAETTEPSQALRYVDISTVTNTGTVGAPQEWTFETAPSRARRLARPGDTIISTVRTYLEAIAYVDDAIADCVYSTGFAVVQPKEMMDPRYLYYGIRSAPFVSEVARRSVGVSYPAVNPSVLADIEIPVPSLDEQRRVAADIDEQAKHLDSLLARNARLSTLVKERQQSLTDALVTGRTEDSRIETPLMFLTDPARPPMYGILMPGPSLPEGISVVDAGDVEADRLDPAHLRRTSAEIEAPYARSRLIAGDLLMSIRGSFGAVAQVAKAMNGANVSRDVARIAAAPGVHPRWLLHALRSRFVFGQLSAGAMGSAVRGINIRSLKRVKVPVPPADEQAQIAAILDQSLTRSTGLAKALDCQRALLSERRRCLVSACMADIARGSERKGVAA